MYIGFLHLHDTLRWLLLLSLLVTLARYLNGWIGNKRWTKKDNLLGIIFVSLMDIQVLTGLVLYFFLSPVTKTAFADFGAAMKNDALRFYAVEHLAMMVIALALIHIGRAKSKKAASDLKKFKTAAIFIMISFAVIVAAIPWGRL